MERISIETFQENNIRLRSRIINQKKETIATTDQKKKINEP